MSGKFVISLDMELMWGVRAKTTKENYGSHVLGERQAIPAMLDLFERKGIHATWAVVGMAMCDGLDELLARAPEERPTYTDPAQSAYSYLSEAGASERQDPYYFAPSMIREMAACPNQEICTHTFSHYYCLEPGQTPAQFAADLQVARKQLDDWKLSCDSIVFPRNQYRPEHLDICASNGIAVFRGNEKSWLYRSATGRLRRAGRLADTYLPISGARYTHVAQVKDVVDVPSSRLLRAYNDKLKWLEALRLNRITTAMSAAAKAGTVFHLWWHPHNFGVNTGENLAFLERVLNHFQRLSGEYGMKSATMSEAAKAA